MAGNVVSLVFAGDSKSLEKSFSKVGSSAKDMAGDLDKAGDKVKSFGGRVENMNDKVDASESKFMGAADLLDGLGGAFGLPTEGITNMARSFGDLAGGFTSVIAPAFTKIIGMLGFQTAATTAQAGATTAATGAQWSLNAALSANPIGAVVLAILALIGVGVLLWKNWDTVKDALSAVWGKMQDAFDWAKRNWPLLLAILTGPIGLAVLAIVKHWDDIKAGFTAVKDWIVDRVGDIVSLFSGLPARLKAAAAGLFDWYFDMFKAAFNAVAQLWNSIEFKLPEVDLPGPLGKVGGQTIGLPDLPKFHQGGIVPGAPGTQVPIMAMAGETVVPAGRAGGVNITIHAGAVVTENQLADYIQKVLLRKQKRTGSLGFA